MAEYIVATPDISELKKELAVNVVAKKVMELTVANSGSTHSVWFLPQEVVSEGLDRHEVFNGLADPMSADLTDIYPAVIETDDGLLVLEVDFASGE